MANTKRLSLSNKISLYILLLVVVIFATIGAIVSRYNTARAQEQVLLYTNSLVDNVVGSVEARMLETERQVAEYLPEIQANLSDTTALNRIIMRLISGDSLLVGGSITFRPGYVGEGKDSLYMEYVSRGQGKSNDKRYRQWRVDAADYDYTSMNWYTDPMALDKPMWSDPYFDRGAGDVFMTTYSHPVHDASGRACGVLTADLSIQDLLTKMDELRPVSGSRSIILTAGGNIIGRRDSVFVMSENNLPATLPVEDRYAFRQIVGNQNEGARESHFEFDYNGTLIYVVYGHVPHTDWSVCCVYRYDDVVAVFGTLNWLVPLILVAGMIALIILIRILIVRNMRPIEADIRAKQRIDSEIHIASAIQLSLVPHDFTHLDDGSGLELYARLTPARQVGGDFYDFFVRDRRLFFVVGDVSGKGIPAALFMGMAHTVFRIASQHTEDPACIMDSVNNALALDNTTNTFVTMFVGVLDLDTGVLGYCNAGHNPPVIFTTDGPARFLDMQYRNLPSGLFSDFAYQSEEIALATGTKLLIYTDGVNEAENARHEQFGDRAMLDTVQQSGAHSSPCLTIDALSDALRAFTQGAEQSDDITMLCLRWGSESPDNVRRLTMANTLNEIKRLPAFIDSVVGFAGAARSAKDTLNLAIEEALVNVINYAYPKGQTGKITLEARTAEADGDATTQVLTFILTDWGEPFDPTAQPTVDVDADLDMRPIGGLGIHLYSTIMDSVTYRRTDGANVLTLTKAL